MNSWHAPPSKMGRVKNFRKLSPGECQKSLILEGQCIIGGQFFWRGEQYFFYGGGGGGGGVGE